MGRMKDLMIDEMNANPERYQHEDHSYCQQYSDYWESRARAAEAIIADLPFASDAAFKAWQDIVNAPEAQYFDRDKPEIQPADDSMPF